MLCQYAALDATERRNPRLTLTDEPKCATQRGGLYDPSGSKTWEALGTWQLSLQYLGFSGNGEYGMEMVEIGDTDMAGSTQGHSSIAFDKAVTATFNITDPFLGMLGLGITEASFDSRVVKSPLVAAVEESKRLPSYSYGYTAGAHYSALPSTPRGRRVRINENIQLTGIQKTHPSP